MRMQQYNFIANSARKTFSNRTNVAATILAGGKNRRMNGVNKSFIRVKDTPIIQRTIDILKGIFEEVIIVTNSFEDYAAYKGDCSIIADRIRNIGPLGGMFTALSQTSKTAVFFVACDMPFLHNEFILNQLAYFEKRNCDALVPRIGGTIEPLHAIYKKILVDDIRDFVQENRDYSVRSFLKTINVCYWDLRDSPFHRDIFRNVNTQEDVTAIQGLKS
jgi:molybdopterin-guanine dinucleotide biosynthesis protein A